MKSRFSHPILRVSTALLLLATAALGVWAQDDPDPNSPTPILITEVESTRALAQTQRGTRKINPSRLTSQAFSSNSRIVLYATNLQLMEGEGANAFRIYVTDVKGRTYRYPVIDIQRSLVSKHLYELTVHLTDELKFWEPPTEDGDVLIYLTWRGLASNQVKLGLGRTGGAIKESEGAKPMPLASVSSKITKTVPPAEAYEPEYVGYRWSGDRKRMLEQSTFGPTFLMDNSMRRLGLRSWLNAQLDAPYPSPAYPYPNQPLKPGTAPGDCDGDQTVTPDVPATCFRDTYTMYPIQTWHSQEALYGTSQLRHRVAWALSQIWVTSGNDIQQSRHMVEYHKVLSANAFGNYRNLMQQMTLNPTMGTYLDMSISTRFNPNENYARELLQLFTVGLFMLNQDGTYQLDGSGNPIPTYDQETVNNFTKVLTGWRLCSVVGASCPNLVNAPNYIDPMLLNAGVNQANINNNLHDLTAKTLFNYPGSTTTNIAACGNCTTFPNIQTYATNSLNQTLDNVFNHPSLGPYVSKVMIQHMVTSDPTPAYVSRVAGVFNNNGFGVRGDMRAVVKAILLDPEARGDAKTDPNYGKLREPWQYATNILRHFNVRSADGLGLSDGVFFQRGEYTGMNQIPFRSPTVFNYFPPDYVVPNSSLLGPEFALLTTGTTIARANFINRFTFTNPAVAISAPTNNGGAPNGTSLDFSDLQALSTADSTGNQLVDELNRRMMHGTMSAQMKSTILTAVTAIVSTDPLQRARQAVYLVATSSQYQVQR
ncbi:MAG: DUF1800 family protein [Pyrinomonadaceae bacterium]